MLSIGHAFGIPVRLHWSLVILVVLGVAVAGGVQHLSALELVLALLFLVAVLASVLAHEFGHALVARRLRIEPHDIVLTAVGGWTRLQSIPSRARDEIRIAAAGPLVNLTICGLVASGLVASGHQVAPSQELIGAGFWRNILWANVLLVAANLVPVLPMDGGRLVRAGLGGLFGFESATAIVGRIGQVAVLVAAGVLVWQHRFVGALAAVMLVGMCEMEISRVAFLAHRRLVLQNLSRWVIKGAKVADYDSAAAGWSQRAGPSADRAT